MIRSLIREVWRSLKLGSLSLVQIETPKIFMVYAQFTSSGGGGGGVRSRWLARVDVI